MTTEANTVLDDEQIAEIEALSAKVPDGPWFAATDDADDVPDHRRSGLALVDTGRSGDWWIARLCEWHIANFIAASKTNVDALCQTVKALQEKFEQLNVVSGEWARTLDRIRAWSKCDDGYPLDEHINNITINCERLQARLSEVEAVRDQLSAGLSVRDAQYKAVVDLHPRAIELCKTKADEWRMTNGEAAWAAEELAIELGKLK